MEPDCDALRRANEAFYRALGSLDLAAMDGVWLHDASVRCIHPGWDALVGWPAVRESWGRIFANTAWIRVVPTEVAAHSFGSVGLVSCLENISTTREEAVSVAVAYATNVFRKADGAWRLFLHHASPSPLPVTPTEGLPV